MIMPRTRSSQPRGFALLIAIILASVTLAVGLALLDVAYKQIILSSVTKNSQDAFYKADTALECALYWDQKSNSFDYNTPNANIICSTLGIQNYASQISGNTRITTYTMPCAGGTGTLASVTVYKTNPAAANAYCDVSAAGVQSKTCIYSEGYNFCSASDARRIARGIRAIY